MDLTRFGGQFLTSLSVFDPPSNVYHSAVCRRRRQKFRAEFFYLPPRRPEFVIAMIALARSLASFTPIMRQMYVLERAIGRIVQSVSHPHVSGLSMEGKMSLSHRMLRVLGFGRGLNRVAVICVLAIATIAPLTAAAQANQWCHWIGPPDDQVYVCEPQPGTNQGSRRQAPAYKWAAIAISKARLRTFTAWQAQSRYAAEKTAINLCTKFAKDCIIATSGPDCIAFAVGTNWAYGYGGALDYITSDHLALAQCAAHGGVKCIVTAHPCSDDGPVNNTYTSMAAH